MNKRKKNGYYSYEEKKKTCFAFFIRDRYDGKSDNDELDLAPLDLTKKCSHSFFATATTSPRYAHNVKLIRVRIVARKNIVYLFTLYTSYSTIDFFRTSVKRARLYRNTMPQVAADTRTSFYMDNDRTHNSTWLDSKGVQVRYDVAVPCARIPSACNLFFYR